MSKQIDLTGCPQTQGYLDVTKEDCMLLFDIQTLTEILPDVMMASDCSTFDLTRVGIEISYVIDHLKGLRDEMLSSER